MQALARGVDVGQVRAEGDAVQLRQLSGEDAALQSGVKRGDARLFAVLLVKDLRDAVAQRGIRLTWDESLTAYLTKKAFSVKYGARSLRRLIEKEVENALAAEIIAACNRPIAGAHLTSDGETVAVQTV